MMANSGARGNMNQIRQLAGMRGLMAEPLRQDHRDAHPRELPRGPERSGILHLLPRRPKGPGGHRPAYRRLGLSDPPPGRRLPGRHRPGGRLLQPRARRRRASSRRHHGRQRRRRSRCPTASWAASLVDDVVDPETGRGPRARRSELDLDGDSRQNDRGLPASKRSTSARS